MRRRTYLYRISDNADTMRSYGASASSAGSDQPSSPSAAREQHLVRRGRARRAADAVPFLDLLAAPKPQGYGSP